jgi:short-subunit dehydrogenase
MPQKTVAIITGASSGIGEATAYRFAQAGIHVVLAARRIDRLQAVAEECRHQGVQALAVQADLMETNDIQQVLAICLSEFGQIDLLFNNAGFGRLGWLEELDPINDIEAQLRLNLLSLIWMTQAVLPLMISQRSGHIINMASAASFIGTPTYSIYAASKFGVRGFTEALRREVGIHNIHVSGIYPGGVHTDFSSHTGAFRKTGITTPDRLRLSTEQVAEAVYRLVERPDRSRILPWVMQLAVWGNALAPGLVDWAIENRFTRRERQP